MTIHTRKCWNLLAVAMVCLAIAAFAQNGTHAQAPSHQGKTVTANLNSTPAQASASVKPTKLLRIAVPESSALGIFGANLLGLAAFIFVARRRWGLRHVKPGSASDRT